MATLTHISQQVEHDESYLTVPAASITSKPFLSYFINPVVNLTLISKKYPYKVTIGKCWFSNQDNKEETYCHNRLDLDVNGVGEANGDDCNPPRVGVHPQNVVQSDFGVLGRVQPH